MAEPTPIGCRGGCGAKQPDDEAYRATVAMLMMHAKPAKKVTREEILEIAAMSVDDLRRRTVVARDWHRLFASCLDGLPELQELGAPPDGCWFPRDIRRVVENLLTRNARLKSIAPTAKAEAGGAIAKETASGIMAPAVRG